MPTWPTGQVCRMTGVSSRTLRHYHRIGLLRPAAVGAGGVRHYGRAELLRLQRILLMRELGLPLADIAAVLDAGGDPAGALRTHLRDLLAERDRIDTLVTTVRRTLDALEEEGTMGALDPETLFAGFDTAAYTDRARAQWPAQWEQAARAADGRAPADWEADRAGLAAQLERMAAHLAAGRPVTDPAVQAEVHDHYLRVSRMWTPDADSFAHLGRVYAEEGPWREVYEAVAPGLADYQCEAMAAYALARLDTRREGT
ncbi:MerR family transcriptional regulator [Nocardiopsis sp. NPDC057823]|uniref:MerR family transcriptional regulator n=1 Tax=Nocardiopsis sp. NPDC057823 TaxID=3346256 RepID=UPI00366DA682